MKKRVGLDARLTRQMSVGMKTYARELTARLPRVAPDLDFMPFSAGANFGLQEQLLLPLAMRRAKVGVAHFLSLYTPVAAPRPYIVTVHDLIHLRFPQYFKAKIRPYYQTVVRFVCARAARVITDDERTVADLQHYLGVPSERVRVIPLGVEDTYLQGVSAHRGARPYVLYSGNHREHKDLRTLFAAWDALPENLEMDLYVTGSDDFGSELAGRARTRGRIVTLGDVSIANLAAYYAGASALMHPALCEGFGLPMLEAMASRCPVVACEDALPGALRGAALTFRAGDANQARDALVRVFADEGLRSALVNEGRTRAEALSWDRCAARTAEIYRDVLEGRNR